MPILSSDELKTQKGSARFSPIALNLGAVASGMSVPQPLSHSVVSRRPARESPPAGPLGDRSTHCSQRQPAASWGG